MKGRPSLPSYCTSKRPSIQSFLWFTSEVHDLLSCHAVAQTLNFYALLPIHRFVHIKSHYQAALKYTLPFLCVCVCVVWWVLCFSCRLLLLLLCSSLAGKIPRMMMHDGSPPFTTKQTHTKHSSRPKARLPTVSSPRSGPPPEVRVRKDTQ